VKAAVKSLAWVPESPEMVDVVIAGPDGTEYPIRISTSMDGYQKTILGHLTRLDAQYATFLALVEMFKPEVVVGGEGTADVKAKVKPKAKGRKK
jgi:hypothetical protein